MYIYIYLIHINSCPSPVILHGTHPTTPTSARRAAAALSASPARSRRRRSFRNNRWWNHRFFGKKCIQQKHIHYAGKKKNICVHIYIYICVSIRCKIQWWYFLYLEEYMFVHIYMRYFKKKKIYLLNMYVKSVYCICKMYVWRDMYDVCM